MSTRASDRPTTPRRLTTPREDEWRPIYGWIMVVTAILAALFTATAVFAHVHGDRVRELAAREHVTGVLQADPTPYGRYRDAVAPVRVTVADGSSHVVRTDVSLYAGRGDHTRLWVTHDGRRAATPTGSGKVWAASIGLGLVGAVAGVIVAYAGCGLHTSVSSRRRARRTA